MKFRLLDWFRKKKEEVEKPEDIALDIYIGFEEMLHSNIRPLGAAATDIEIAAWRKANPIIPTDKPFTPIKTLLVKYGHK